MLLQEGEYRLVALITLTEDSSDIGSVCLKFPKRKAALKTRTVDDLFTHNFTGTRGSSGHTPGSFGDLVRG